VTIAAEPELGLRPALGPSGVALKRASQAGWTGAVRAQAGKVVDQRIMESADRPGAVNIIDRNVARIVRGERLADADRQAAQEAFERFESSWQAAAGRNPSAAARAEYYVTACKMGIILHSRHGGWPFRYAYMPAALAGVRKLLEENNEPFLLACAVTAAVHEREFEFAKTQLRKLERLHEQWTTYTYKILKLAVSVRPQYQTFLDQLQEERGDDLPPAPEPVHLETTLLGCELVTKNLFRLAELPVTASHPAAQQRLKIGLVAASIGAPVPRGPAPLLPRDAPADDLRAAVEHTRDPLHRLVHEMFWFWPAGYTGESDEGLACLLDGRVDDAEHRWRGNTATLVGSHNLALLLTLRALEDDGGEERWTEACAQWMASLAHPRLLDVLTRRVEDLADARLPASLVPRVHAQLPVIAASIPVGVLIRDAKEGRLDAARRLRAVIDGRTANATIFRAATDALTREWHDRVRFLTKSFVADSERAVLRTPELATPFLEQVRPLLDLLAIVYPPNDPYIVSLYDSVALHVSKREIAFSNKTEAWATCIGLAEQALGVARSETLRQKLAGEVETDKRNLEEDNSWVGPRYFELPQPVVTQLEEARAYSKAGKFEQAVEMLRGVFFARHSRPEADLIAAVVRHSAAFTLRKWGVRIWNDALDRRREQRTAIRDSALQRLTQGGGRSAPAQAGGGSLTCTKCGAVIRGKYFSRTYNEKEYDFCIGCDEALKGRYQAADAEFEREANKSSQRILLAQYFNPDNRHLRKQMEDVVPRSPWELLVEWKFVDISAAVDELLRPALADARPAILDWIAGQLPTPDAAAWTMLNRLFGGVTGPDATDGQAEVAALLAHHADFTDEFGTFCLGPVSSATAILLPGWTKGLSLAVPPGRRRRWLEAATHHPSLPKLAAALKTAYRRIAPDDPYLAEVAGHALSLVRGIMSGSEQLAMSGDEFSSFLGEVAALDPSLRARALHSAALGAIVSRDRAGQTVRELGALDPDGTVIGRLVDDLGQPSAPPHALRYLLGAMLTQGSEPAKCAAVARVGGGPVAGLDRHRFLALALADDAAAVRALAMRELARGQRLVVKPLIEAGRLPRAHYGTAAAGLISGFQVEHLDEVPPVRELVAHCLTLTDRALAERCVVLLKHRYPDWSRHVHSDDCLPWLKWCVSSGSDTSRGVARTLLADYGQAGAMAKLRRVLAGRTEPQAAVDAWWDSI
jgi:hypothetical protein